MPNRSEIARLLQVCGSVTATVAHILSKRRSTSSHLNQLGSCSCIAADLSHAADCRSDGLCSGIVHCIQSIDCGARQHGVGPCDTPKLHNAIVVRYRRDSIDDGGGRLIAEQTGEPRLRLDPPGATQRAGCRNRDDFVEIIQQIDQQRHYVGMWTGDPAGGGANPRIVVP
jgi:hypothetical protein